MRERSRCTCATLSNHAHLQCALNHYELHGEWKSPEDLVMPPTDPPPPRRCLHQQSPGTADRETSPALGELVSLTREFPHWAIWRTGGREWTAARAPARRQSPPGPAQVLTWIH